MAEIKKHPVSVEGFDGTLEDLAQRIFRLRYDKVEEFCRYGRDELRRQAARDRDLLHPELARWLENRAEGMEAERVGFEGIFKLCRSHMAHELDE